MSTEYQNVQKASSNSRIVFLVKDSVLYGGVSTLSKFLHVFLLPILTRYISPEDYGAYDLLMVLSSIALLVIIAGTDSSVARFFYEFKEKSDKNNLISQTLVFQICFSVLIGAILLIFSKPLLSLYFEEVKYLSELQILIVAVPFIVITRFAQNVLKWVFLRFQFLVVSAGTIIFTITFSVASIILIEAEIKYLFYSLLVSNIIFSVLGLYYCRSYLTIPKSFDTIKPQLLFGIPLSFNQFIISILPAIERYFITIYLNITALGFYAVANKISQLSQFVINGFQVAWGPLSYSIMNEDNANDTYSKVLNYYTLFICLFTVVFASLMPILIKLLATTAYESVSFIILIIMTSKLLGSITGLTAIGIELSKKTYLKVNASILQIIASVIFMFILVKEYGLIGVSMGVLLGNIIFVGVINYYATKVHDVRFNLYPNLSLFAFSVLLSFLILFINTIWIKLSVIIFTLSAITLFSIFYTIGLNDSKKILRKVANIINVINHRNKTIS